MVQLVKMLFYETSGCDRELTPRESCVVQLLGGGGSDRIFLCSSRLKPQKSNERNQNQPAFASIKQIQYMIYMMQSIIPDA